MNQTNTTILLTFALLSLICACQSSQPVGRDGWLKGSTNEKLETVASQLRGLDMAMVETGYRYQELYWAVQDTNWRYAHYQVEKLKSAMEYALVRRPKRAEPAREYLTVALPAMEKALDSKDLTVFDRQFAELTQTCNNCHKSQNADYYKVKPPLHRQSPIRGN
jgi:hypothetical protein